MAFRVFLQGLEVYGYHGVSDEEQFVGHRYVADITLSVDGQADETDKILDTVNYAEVGELISKRISDAKFRTVERLAAHVADGLLEAYPSVRSVTVRLAKRLPPLPHIAEQAGVELRRSRPEDDNDDWIRFNI